MLTKKKSCIKRKQRDIKSVQLIDNIKQRKLNIFKKQLFGQLPKLDRADIIKRNYTFGHQACIDLLFEGFIDAFIEFYQLITDSRQKSNLVEEGSQFILLENEQNKVEILHKYMSKSSKSHIEEDYDAEYFARTDPAQIFLELGDLHIAEYLYKSSLLVFEKNMTDKEERKANSLHQIALLCEYREDLEEALFFLEQAKLITVGNDEWLNFSEDAPLNYEIAMDIHRVTLALKNSIKNEDPLRAVALTSQALAMAKEINHLSMKAEAYQELGNSLLAIEKYVEAEKNLIKFKITSIKLNDLNKLCESYRDLAKVYESLGQFEQAVKYHNICQNVAKRRNMGDTLATSCILLGFLYTQMNRFKEACVQFQDAYYLVNDYFSPLSSPVESAEEVQAQEESVEDEKKIEKKKSLDDFALRENPKPVVKKIRRALLDRTPVGIKYSARNALKEKKDKLDEKKAQFENQDDPFRKTKVTLINVKQKLEDLYMKEQLEKGLADNKNKDITVEDLQKNLTRFVQFIEPDMEDKAERTHKDKRKSVTMSLKQRKILFGGVSSDEDSDYSDAEIEKQPDSTGDMYSDLNKFLEKIGKKQIGEGKISDGTSLNESKSKLGSVFELLNRRRSTLMHEEELKEEEDIGLNYSELCEDSDEEDDEDYIEAEQVLQRNFNVKDGFYEMNLAKNSSFDYVRVLCGIGRGHIVFPQVATVILTGDNLNNLFNLLEWKNNRGFFLMYPAILGNPSIDNKKKP